MRLPSFRVRTLMVMVVAVALLVWGSMMGSRSYEYYGRARMFAEQEQGWREIAARKKVGLEIRLGMQLNISKGLTAEISPGNVDDPWLVVEPDPWAPGAEEAYRQNIEAGYAKRRRRPFPVTIPPIATTSFDHDIEQNSSPERPDEEREVADAVPLRPWRSGRRGRTQAGSWPVICGMTTRSPVPIAARNVVNE